MELFYSSTRDKAEKVTASQAILQGLAQDGGLYVPSYIPALSVDMDVLKDMSYQEIGEALELPSGTVKSRISRAREKIRRSLDGNLFDFSSSRKGNGGMRS